LNLSVKLLAVLSSVAMCGGSAVANSSVAGLQHLENEQLRVTVDARGGVVTSLVDKASAWDAARSETATKWQGLAKERIYADGSNRLFNEPLLWQVKSPVLLRGQAKFNLTPAVGASIEKTVSLEKDAVRVDVLIEAEREADFAVGIHNFLPGIGIADSQGFWHSNGQKVEKYRETGDHHIPVAQAQWFATASKQAGILADFTVQAPQGLSSYLDANISTLEWRYQPQGRQLKYSYRLKPFSAKAPVPELKAHFVSHAQVAPSDNLQHPVGTVPPLTTKRPTLPPDQSGYAFVGNIEQMGYVAAQAPSMIYFKPVNPSHRPDLFLALPEGIELLGGFRGFQFVKQGPTQINGQTYNVTRIVTTPASSKYTFLWRADAAKNWADGTKLRAYYWGEWSQGKQAPVELPVQVVKIPQVQPFEKIPVWMSIPSDLSAIWPDMAALKQAGFNHMDIWSYVRKDSEFEWGMRVLRESHNRMKSSGIKPIAWIREWWWHDARKEPEGQAMLIDGTRVEALNLSYRGKYFQELIEQGKRLIDEGMYFHCTDPEIFSNGDKIDFSPATIADFREYHGKQLPGVKYVSPIRFEREPDKYPELHQLWNQFKTQRFTDFFADYRVAMEAYMKEKGITESFRFIIYSTYHRGWDGFYGYDDHRQSPVYIRTLEDPVSLSKVFDYISPMLYLDVFANYKDYDMTLAWKDTVVLRNLAKGSPAHVAPLLSTGYPYVDAFDSDLSARMLKSNILETFAGGGRGFGYWGECPIDAMDMKVTAEAVQMLRPYEKLLLDGEVSQKIKAIEGNVFARRIESKRGSLVLVSEYSEQPLTATIECPVEAPATVIDLQTNRKIADITPQNPRFQVKLNQDRALMFSVASAAECSALNN